MKRTYIAPQCEALELHPEAIMLGASDLRIDTNPENKVDGDKALSVNKIWGTTGIWDR